jgi:sodium borate transporter 11
MTRDKISVPKAIVSQCLGGIFFSIFAGQPLIVVMTTAPLILYVKGKFFHPKNSNILLIYK